MLTAVRIAFCFCFLLGAFEETVSWTIDLPQVRKYFFEKSLQENPKTPEKVAYDNIDTDSRHFDYEKYREHYADDYEYHGYMEQKVHDAVRNGSAYLEGLRRAIEGYTRRLEGCQRMNFTMRIIQLRLNTTAQNLTSLSTNLPANFTLSIPTNITDVVTLSTNFTNFMNMSPNFTMFNVSEGFRECMRADLASEHVRRLAQLAIWAANELHDKMYADKYNKHGSDYDDTLVLRLAWFLDRLAHLTGYDPKPQDFVRPQQGPQSSPAPPTISLVPVLISNEDMQFLLSCMKSNSSGSAPERCAFTGRPDALGNPNSFENRGRPVPTTPPADLRLSESENHEYTYSEQDYAEENMPLSLPPKPLTFVKTKRKRSVQEDPLQHVFKYLTKHKAWVGSNHELKANSGEITNNKLEPLKRVKRFIVKKSKHLKVLKPENPTPDLSNFVKHKLGVHFNKDKKQANLIKNFFDKLNVKPLDVKLFKKKVKRSVIYGKKFQPRIPANPQGDISYYVKNKKGTNYDYNAAQVALVRAGLEQAFQTGNIEVVRRYGSNYNPANPMQILTGYFRGTLDV